MNAHPIWPDGAPGARGDTPADVPTLTAFPPARPNGTALLVLPGGGYGALAEHEGAGYAAWLAGQGIAAFVLRYRLGSGGYRHPAMLDDAQQAMRILRAQEPRWTQVGVIGSSAGGHLASLLLTEPDDATRPDFGVLCYPVIDLLPPLHHRGSRENLLGPDASDDLARTLSTQHRVTARTPPCFVWTTAEDTLVPLENSVAFAMALRRAGVPFDLHIYERGPHGIGLGQDGLHPWTADLLFWLRERGYLTA